MNSFLPFTGRYVKHYLKASNGRGHGTHSPFVFSFIRDILNDRNEYPEYDKVESLRAALLRDRSVVMIDDLGAGSLSVSSARRTVSSLVRHSAKPPKLGKLLFRIARYYQPRHIIEMGTSLGLSTCYLALGAKGARVVTLEGAPEVAVRAEANFDRLQIDSIELRRGDFEDTFPLLMAGESPLDLLFVDGNHRKLPTLGYFHQALGKVHNDSMIIFDDIHWSREMEEAWTSIVNHPAVRCSIDLFWMGIVFFRSEFREKQHFLIRF